MVPFLVDCSENIVRGFCDRFILPDVLKKATRATQLIKLDGMDKNIHRRDYDFNFFISHELLALKRKGKITDSILHVFKMEAKNFISTFCNHVISKSPLSSYFAQCAKSLNPINMTEITDLCEKAFHRLFQKLVDSNHMTSSVADQAEQEYKEILY